MQAHEERICLRHWRDAYAQSVVWRNNHGKIFVPASHYMVFNKCKIHSLLHQRQEEWRCWFDWQGWPMWRINLAMLNALWEVNNIYWRKYNDPMVVLNRIGYMTMIDRLCANIPNFRNLYFISYCQLCQAYIGNALIIISRVCKIQSRRTKIIVVFFWFSAKHNQKALRHVNRFGWIIYDITVTSIQIITLTRFIYVEWLDYYVFKI